MYTSSRGIGPAMYHRLLGDWWKSVEVFSGDGLDHLRQEPWKEQREIATKKTLKESWEKKGNNSFLVILFVICYISYLRGC
jgi:hypothetical protein